MTLVDVSSWTFTTGGIELTLVRIFVSHAAEDREIASKLVELLEVGIGVPDDHIFFSSQAGTIQNGEFFVQTILSRLAEAELVVCLISRAYLRSQFCLAEAGAAMIKKKFGVGCKRTVDASDTEVVLAKAMSSLRLGGTLLIEKAMERVQCEPILSQIFSLTIPPTTFSEIGGVLYGVQAGSIQDRETLTELRQTIRHADPNNKLISDVKWVTRLEQFIAFAKQPASNQPEDHRKAKNPNGPRLAVTLPDIFTPPTFPSVQRVVPFSDRSQSANCKLIGVRAENRNKSTMNQANNVSCLLRYEHAGGNAFNCQASFYIQKAGIYRSGFATKIPFLHSAGDSQLIALAIAFSIEDKWHEVRVPTPESSFDGMVLEFGDWTIKGTVSADNADDAIFEIEARVDKAGKITVLTPNYNSTS